MSFYNPLAPVFDATRLEIERSILGLEERLLKRKELDLQLEKDLLQQHHMYKFSRPDVLYDPMERGYSAEFELHKRLRELRTFDPKENLHVQSQRQTQELDYLTRLREIQRHQSAIDHGYALKSQPILPQNDYSPYHQFANHPFDDSAETLVRKYYDGTRAVEFNEELKRSGDKSAHLTKPTELPISKTKNNQQLFSQMMRTMQKKERQQPDHSTVKKYQSPAKQFRDNQSQSNNQPIGLSQQSPFEKFLGAAKFNSIQATTTNLNQQKEKIGIQRNNTNQNLSETNSQDHSPHLQPKHKQRSKSSLPANIPINVLPPSSINANIKKNLSQSHQKQNTKSSQYLSSHQNTLQSQSLTYRPRAKSASKSGTKSMAKSRLSVIPEEAPIEYKFKIWFTKRTKLAEEARKTYEQDHAKNLADFFMSVYEKQNKARKDLIEKCCKMPVVERKYGKMPAMN